MKSLLNESKINFQALAKARERMDDSDDGMSGRCGNWELGLGGYDHGYEIYYRGAPIGRVNYELREYELYDDDFISKEQIPEFLDAIDARGFKDVGYHEEEDDAIDDEDQDMVNEARKQIMWAVNFRSMHTAGHGLYYGQDKRKVQKFAQELEYINDLSGDEAFDDYSYMMEDLFNRYPEIQAIEEFNFRDIVDLPGGYEGVEIGDTIYRFVNRTSIDVYTESTGKQKMKFKKIVKEADGMGMPYDELMAKFLEIQKKLGKKSQKTLVYWTYEPMDEGVQEYLDRKGYEPMGTWYSVQYSSELCWPTGAWLGSKHEKTRQATSVLELCDWFEKNQEKLGGCKFIGALSGYENVNDIKIENGKVVVVFGKTEEVITEGDQGYDSDTPKIYVGTYAKYNNGSIDGKWITLSDYNTYEEFVDACRELHSDENDPEFMVQDYENFPEKWYHEGGLPSEEEFDKINEFYMMDDGDKEAYEAFLDLNLWDDDSIETFVEKYEGHFNTPEDFGVHAVETFGMPENPEYYIDYEAFGRDLTMDWHRGDEDEKDAEGEPEDPDYYYDSDGYQQMEYGSDAEVGEQYIDDVGMDGLGKDTMDYYFDYDQYGRELLMTDFAEQDGFIFSNY